MTRYTLISFLTGSLDFLIALALLHMGFSDSLGLAISIVLAGAANYFALEKWGFQGRKPALSLRRFVESGLVEAMTYAIRLAALWLWRRHFNDTVPTEHLIGLAVAYLAGFVVGYVVRSRYVFRNETA